MRPRITYPLLLAMTAALLFAAPIHAIKTTHTETFSSHAYDDTNYTTALWDTVAGDLRLRALDLTVKGSYDTPGGGGGVAISGDNAYVADGTSGLLIFSVSDPGTPVQVGSYTPLGTAQAVCVAGNRAYMVSSGYGLYIIDVTDPSSPSLLANYNTTGDARDVKVSGGYAYVADGASGLHIFDVSDPALPVITGTANTAGSAIAVDIQGDYAYVADRSWGLAVIDISNPAAPNIVGVYNTPVDAWGVVVAGSVAYVGDANGGLLVFDVSTPTTPTLLASFDPGGSWRRLFVTGNYLYAAAYGSLYAVDVSNPAAPSLAGEISLPGIANCVFVDGMYAYVADGVVGGLQVVEVGMDSPPTKASNWYVPGDEFGVDVQGNVLYVLTTLRRLECVDISDTASPVLLGTYLVPSPGSGFDIVVDGNYAYLAMYDGGLRIVDVSDPSSPTGVGHYAANEVLAVEVAGDVALIADGNSLWSLDVSNPANPTQVGWFALAADGYDLKADGEFLYCAVSTAGLEIVDISDPVGPSFVELYNTGGTAYGVDVAGDVAFVGDLDGGLLALDISDPTTAVLLDSWVPTVSQLARVAVSGNRAYVTNHNYLEVIDVTNPAAMLWLDSYKTANITNGIGRLVLDGDHAFIADRTAGIHLVQVFQRELDIRNNLARSTSISDGGGDIIAVKVSPIESGNVAWAATTEPSGPVESVTSGAWHFFTETASPLVWEATLDWSGPGVNPTVSQARFDWLFDFAAIEAIDDIGNDQGRQVRVSWTRSGHDFVGDASQIVEYGIYRKIDPALPAPPAASATDVPRHPLRVNPPGWDYVTSVPARAEDGYAVVVPTLADSTITGGQYLSHFMVSAMTATPGVFFDSHPDSGYSVDNLAPNVPANLAAAYNTGSGNTLSWDPAPETDFRYFRIYRSTDPNFTPSLATLVAATTGEIWSDSEYDGGGVSYKVTAVDFSGNESGAAMATTATAVVPKTVSKQAMLYQNYPNPFNPTTVIRYDVPAGGAHVEIGIHDVAGRRVRTLVSRTEAAGQREIQWDGRDQRGAPVATGTYFYRMRAGNVVQTRKMVLLK